MNRIFRTLWSVATQSWQAVPETAKTAGKKSASSASGVVVSVALSFALTGGAGAQSPPAVNQLPTGGTVVRGTATISQTATAQAAAMTVNQTSQRAVVNWNTFNLGSAASVNFVQPNAQAVILNRVTDSNPSQIFGRITSNGQVFITNANGVYFSPTSSVDVGAITATTHSISNDNFMSGNYVFERNGATGKVVNEGRINAALGGYVALLAPEVQNTGVVVARAGTVAMAAGDIITLNIGGAGSLAGITTTPSAIASLIENKQAVQAPDGLIILSAMALNKLQAGVIKNSGSLEASSLVSKGGKIYLEGDDITLTTTSKIEAKGATGGGTVLVGGDWQGSGDLRQATKVTMAADASIDASATNKGDGGKVVMWSDVHSADSQTMIAGTVNAEGRGEQTKGGQIETSGAKLDIADSASIRMGGTGASGGRWLLDPVDFTIAATGGNITGAALGSSITAGNTVEILNTSGTTGTLGNINVNNNVSWNNTGVLKLTASGGVTGSGNFAMGAVGGGGLIFDQAGTSTFSGIISGVGKFTKTGLGTLTLSKANTYTLGTSVEQGTLSRTIGNAFGAATGRITVLSGASLDLNGLTNPNPITLNGTGDNGTGALKNSGAGIGASASVVGIYSSITLGSDVSIIGNSSITINTTQVIGNNYSLILGGTGTSSSFSTTAILNIGTGTITKVGTGNWSIQSSNTFTGNVYVNEGTLTAFSLLSTSTPLGSSVGSTTVRSGASLSFTGTPSTVAEEPLNLNGFGANDATGALNYDQNASATINYTGAITLSGTTRINVNRNKTLNIKSTLNNDVYDIVKTGLGTLNLQGTPTMTTDRPVKTGYEFVSASDASSCTSTCSSVYGSTPAISYLIYDTAGALTTDANITGIAVFNGAPTNTSAAGSYNLTYSSGLSSRDYALFPKTSAVTWAVTKAPLTVTPTLNQSKIYGAIDPLLTYSTSALAGADTSIAGLSGALSRSTGEDVANSYAYSVASLSATNYTFTLAPSSSQFSITPRPITLTATPLNKTYGNADPTLAASITAGSLGSVTVSDTLADVTGTLTRTAGENVGSYDVALGTGSKAGNYDITYATNNQALTIDPRAVVLAGQMNFSGQSTLDTASTGSTLAATNLVGNDSLTFGGTAALAAADAGTQAITGFSGLTLSNSNYTKTGASGSVRVLPTSAINVTALNNTDVSALIGSQLAGITGSQIGSLSNSQLQVFSAQQLASLSTSQLSGFNAAQIGSLSSAQLQGIRPPQVALLLPAQLAGLGADQLASFSPPQLQALSATQVNALAPAQLSALSAAQISLLTGNTAAPLSFPQVFALSPNQVSAIQPAQLSRMTAAEVGSFTDAQLQALTPAQIAAISPTSFGALGAEQIMAMSSAQLQSLSPEQLASFTPLQVASLSPAELNNFDATQLAAIGIFPKQASIDKFEAAIPVMTAVAPDVARMSGLEIRALTPELLNTLSSQQIASLKPAQLQALTTTQLSQLTPEQVDNLTPAQLAVMSPRQLQTLPTAPVTTADITPRKGVLAVTILQNATSKPVAAGIAFEQDADTISLKVTAAPAALPISEDVVFSQKLTTFLVATTDGEMVEFQGSLVNNRMVIVASSDASKKIARNEMNLVLAAAVTSLGKDNRVMLANLEGVVLDLR